MHNSLFIKIVLFFALISAPVFANAASDPDDDEESKEHPIFSRMPGFYIDSYETKQFEKYEFKDKKGNSLAVEGNFYEISFCIKKE